MNVDVAINKDKHQAGLGVMIRDDERTVIIAASNQTMFYGYVAQTKAVAINLGIHIANEANLLPLVVKTNAKRYLILYYTRRAVELKFFGILLKFRTRYSESTRRLKFNIFQEIIMQLPML